MKKARAQQESAIDSQTGDSSLLISPGLLTQTEGKRDKGGGKKGEQMWWLELFASQSLSHSSWGGNCTLRCYPAVILLWCCLGSLSDSACLCCFLVTPASHVGIKERQNPQGSWFGVSFSGGGSPGLSCLLFSSQAGGL